MILWLSFCLRACVLAMLHLMWELLTCLCCGDERLLLLLFLNNHNSRHFWSSCCSSTDDKRQSKLWQVNPKNEKFVKKCNDDNGVSMLTCLLITRLYLVVIIFIPIKKIECIIIKIVVVEIAIFALLPYSMCLKSCILESNQQFYQIPYYY